MMYRNTFLSSLDYSRLQDLVITAKQFATSNIELLDSLECELARANIVSPEEIPPYVVTMNTCVHLTDLLTGEDIKVLLVYPRAGEGELSILSGLGVAILGFSVGDTIEWNSPRFSPISDQVDRLHRRPSSDTLVTTH